MSVNWNWSDKCGEIELVAGKSANGSAKRATVSLYTGNCFLIMLTENNEENTYSMYGWFYNEEHMNICLGLKADGDGIKNNMYDNDYATWEKVRIDKRKFKRYPKLITAVAKAFNNIDIELYTSAEGGE